MTNTSFKKVTMPPALLDPSLWRGFNVDSLYTLDQDGTLRPSDPTSADAVYNPSDHIPSHILCRISESTKRLEKGLSVETVAQPLKFGSVSSVIGGGSPIGVIVTLKSSMFRKAYCTPDGCHLVSVDGEIYEDGVVTDVYNYKTFRSFLVGEGKASCPHDFIITAKKRWFRARNDPKALGFSKDNKS